EGFVQYTLYTLKQLRNSNFKIVLLDLGGLPSAENREILKHCDAVILLVREDKQEIVEKWKQLISEINIRCIGEIESSMEGQGQSNIEISDKIQGRLVSLDRQGIPEQTSKEIQKISEFLLGYTGARVKEQSTVKFKIHVDEREELKLIFVDITILANGGIIKPAELEELVNAVNIPITKADRGVVISGRLPVWAFSALVHKFHPFKWLGTWDPRLQGAVVVASHDPTVKIGEVVPCAPPTEK
ncbi:CRISPR-associated protein Csx3, partial [Archaeoglobales archaeon]